MNWHDESFRRPATCIKQADDGAPGPTSSGPTPAASAAAPAAQLPDFSQSPLPAAMLAVAHQDTPQNRSTLYDAMFKTWFVVPIKEGAHPDTPGMHDIREDTASAFSLEHDSSGQCVAVAFTDEEALRNWNKEILWIALQGVAFFQAVSNTEAQEIVINPFEPENPASKMIRPGGIVTRWEFEALAAGRHPARAGAEAQNVLVTMPKHMPSAEIFTALAQTASAFPAVVAMYFAQLIYPEGHPHKAVAVEFVPNATDDLIEPAMVALEKKMFHLFPRKQITDLLLAASPLGQSVATTGEKFYNAKK